jgi:hypothetical protein
MVAGRFVASGDFLDINHRAIGDAPHRIQPGAAFEFDVVRIPGFAAQQRIAGQGNAQRAQRKGIETKRNHWQTET